MAKLWYLRARATSAKYSPLISNGGSPGCPSTSQPLSFHSLTYRTISTTLRTTQITHYSCVYPSHNKIEQIIIKNNDYTFYLNIKYCSPYFSTSAFRELAAYSNRCCIHLLNFHTHILLYRGCRSFFGKL